MLCNVISVCLSGLGGPDFFAQGCKPIVVAMIVPTMQAMRHPVSGLCPPPDIALECICQTALCEMSLNSLGVTDEAIGRYHNLFGHQIG